MSSNRESMIKMPLSLLEAGLLTMKTGLQTMQEAMGAFTGHMPAARTKANEPPLKGPQNLDDAISSFVNHVVRIGRLTRPEAADIASALQQTVKAAQMSFGYIDFSDPRNVMLPIEAAMSAGTLASEVAMRAMAAFTVLGPERIPSFVDNTVEMFSEVGMFVSLQYQNIIKQHKEKLDRNPDDAVTRCELGRTYVKCGLYDHAIKELELAAKDPSVRSLAMHEAGVAHYRAGRFEESIKAEVESMKANPDNERARVVMWLATRSTNGYPEWVPEEFRMECKAGYEPTKLRYVDISDKIGLDKTSAGRGTAIFDYNNDGYLDVMIAAAHGGANLYRNNGDGTFTDVSIESGIDRCVNGFAISAGDYDNDGNTDVFITRLGFYGGEGTLFHNNGDGTFTEVTDQAGVKCWGPAFTTCWVDYDCDGFLDLFIANNLGGIFDRHVQNRLYHNNGDGTFTDVTEQAGLAAMSPTIGACWGDYNNDGYPDLFISSGLGRPQLFRNNGDGTFTEVSAECGMNDFVIGSTCFFADYDNDGWLDIVQFNWSDHEDVIYSMQHGETRPDGPITTIWHNNRNGTFTPRNREIGLVQSWGTMSGNAADINNDGYLDLLLGNGSPRMDRMEPFICLENDGQKFHNVTFTAGFPFSGKSHGTNAADLFGDGRICVYIAAGGAYPGDLLTSNVFQPAELPGNYLNVRLKGVKSNRSAIGARLMLHHGETLQMREISGGTNFGCLPFEQHFGLGDRTAVDALEIRWPSGLNQRLTGLPINDTIEITEGVDGWKKVYPAKVAEAPAVAAPAEPEAATPSEVPA